MLQALIRISEGYGDLAQQGDVIVLALPTQPWGSAERKEFLIADWSDPDIEIQLLARQDAGVINPVAIFPYRVVDAEGELLRHSNVRVDVPALEIELEPGVASPILSFEDYTAITDSEPPKKSLVSSTTGGVKRFFTWLIGGTSGVK